jgi:precorrin-3B C17-methyltransferase
VGLGPGLPATITEQARLALAGAEVVVGYKSYIAQAEPWLAGKEVLSSGMTRELERAEKALDLALAGRKVALVSGGDPGVYGMAPVVFELAHARGLALGQPPAGLMVQVVPGVPAVTAAASLLGAPLSHDFACVSLSDRLTPWELIAKRLDLAAQADFVIALYNPKSKGRDWQYAQALEIVGRWRAATTPVGVVTAALRQDQGVVLTTLAEAAAAEVGMQTIVVIGNTQSFAWSGRMVTPRGYMRKYGAAEPAREG